MKYVSFLSVLFISLNVSSSIEFSPLEEGRAKPEEISRSRSCFQEMKMHGCGDPGEDIQHFLTCLPEVRPLLTITCGNLMKELYGSK
jgi:hypothetical protein